MLLSFPYWGLCTHAATDPVLGRKMENIPSQSDRGDEANAEILESSDIALSKKGEKHGPCLFPAFGKTFQNTRG